MLSRFNWVIPKVATALLVGLGSAIAGTGVLAIDTVESDRQMARDEQANNGTTNAFIVDNELSSDFGFTTALLAFADTANSTNKVALVSDDREMVVAADRLGGRNRQVAITSGGVKRRGVATQGMASYYCCEFHGRRTASGEVYNQHALTAAHPTLRFGTRVSVTNLNNGRSVVVRINDRGPTKQTGRNIDLSLGAARAIDMVSAGVVPVRLEIL